jgi:hypothetical protein
LSYEESADIKADLRITDTAIDAQITDWGDKASEEFNDLVYEISEKRRRITALPELPLTGADITETVKDATNSLVKERYYLFTKNPEMAKQHRDVAMRLINQYVNRLKVDTTIYGRVAR